MPKSERDGDVHEILVFPLQHELPVSPAEIYFVEETTLPLFQDLVGQSSWVGEPQLEWCANGDARADAGTLRHGKIHYNTVSSGVFLWSGHHGVGAGPVERVDAGWTDDG